MSNVKINPSNCLEKEYKSIAEPTSSRLSRLNNCRSEGRTDLAHLPFLFWWEWVQNVYVIDFNTNKYVFPRVAVRKTYFLL